MTGGITTGAVHFEYFDFVSPKTSFENDSYFSDATGHLKGSGLLHTNKMDGKNTSHPLQYESTTRICIPTDLLPISAEYCGWVNQHTTWIHKRQRAPETEELSSST